MMKISFLKILFFTFLLFGLSACAVNHGPVYIKNGKKFGVVSGNFTDRWYDYYERALSYKSGDYFKEALSDLDVAIRKRPKDQRWVNTYGMHFIDYFPNREKGIIYFLLGDQRLSEEALTLSMSQAPSAKARHFLDQSRMKRMVKERRPVTTPEIHVYPPLETREEFVELKGIASDACYVSEIFVSGEKIRIVSSETALPFNMQLFLSEGSHEIEIVVRNLLGGQTKKRVPVKIDRSGPTIIIRDYIPGVSLSGYLTDRSDIESFTVNTIQNIHALKNGFFNVPLNSRMNPVHLLASDDLGNTTELVLSPEETRPLLKSASGHFISGQRLLADNEKPVKFMNHAPQIDFFWDGIENELVVYKNNFHLKGAVRSTSRIKSFKILLEGDPLEISLDGDKGSITPSGQVISFNQSLILKEGKNTVKVLAETVSGDESVKEITIIRKIPEILKPENRFAIKIDPLDKRVRKYETSLMDRFFGHTPLLNGFSAFMDNESRGVFQASLEQDILKKKRFQLVSLDQKMIEMNDTLEASIFNPVKSDKRPLHPDGLLLGNSCVDSYGTEVTVRLVTLTSFEEIITADVFYPGEDKEDLQKMAVELSGNLHHALPVVEGRIEAVSGGELLVSCKNGKIKEGWPLFVYNDSHSRRGADDCLSIGCDSTILGILTMGCDQSVPLGKSDIQVEKGDKVITR